MMIAGGRRFLLILFLLSLFYLAISFKFPSFLNSNKIGKYVLIPLVSLSLTGEPALANREIANIETSGFLFKDTLKISAFDDPKIPGITIYLSDFDRPLTEKLTNNFFNDPSSSSLTCAQTGPISLKADINTGKEGEEVFEESRNLFFKQIRVRRILDKESNTLVYAAYNTRIDKSDDSNKSRFKSSLCAVHVDEPLLTTQR